ncbi:MAG: alpha/beta fold hydrolase, partial [Rhodospirillales bacterium]|nr:alpha/beta fold hydrolase [Rhodospirillales bacterium]
FVPGLMGSRLVDDNGYLWGGSVVDTINRLPDLEYRPNAGAGTDTGNSVRANEILSDFQILGGFEVSAYQPILAFFREQGFVEGKTLFVFPYDWRQSNFVSAKQLADFVDATPQLKDHRFNIVSHSMGGLVSLIYLHRHGGNDRVKYLVTLGTPHLGSLLAFSNLLGEADLKLTLLEQLVGKATLRRVLFSFPSLYELMPHYVRACLVTDGEDVPENGTCDLLSDDLWRAIERKPGMQDVLPKQLATYLEGGRNLRSLTCAPMPPGVTTFRFAGTRISTFAQVLVDSSKTRPVEWNFLDGDGSVAEYSAACGDPASTEIVFSDHLAMLENETVHHRLRNILLASAMGDPFKGAFKTRGGKETITAHTPRVSFELDSQYYLPGKDALATVHLDTGDGMPVPGISLTATLIAGGAPDTPLQSLQAIEDSPGDYVFEFSTPNEEGQYRLRVDIPGAGPVENYFVVIDRDGGTGKNPTPAK